MFSCCQLLPGRFIYGSQLGRSITLNAMLQRSIKTQMDMDLFNGTSSREANKWFERLVLERSHTAVKYVCTKSDDIFTECVLALET